jgi:hypothetical protein
VKEGERCTQKIDAQNESYIEKLPVLITSVKSNMFGKLVEMQNIDEQCPGFQK